MNAERKTPAHVPSPVSITRVKRQLEARPGIVLLPFAVKLFRIAYRLGEARAASRGLPDSVRQSLAFNTATDADIGTMAREQIETLLDDPA